MLATTRQIRKVIRNQLNNMRAHAIRAYTNKCSHPKIRIVNFYDVSLDDDKVVEYLVHLCNRDLVNQGYEPTVRYTHNLRGDYNPHTGMTRRQFAIKAQAAI